MKTKTLRCAITECFSRFTAMTLLAVLICGTGFTVKADAVPDARWVADVNKPGTLMIQTVHTANINVPKGEMSDQAVEELQDIVLEKIDKGLVEATEEAFIEEYLKELFKNVHRYMTPTGELITKEVQVGAVGTGFVITPDGYIVTNAHVVFTPEEELKYQLVQIGLNELIQEETKEFIDSLRSMNIDSTQELFDSYTEAIVNYYVANIQISNLKTQVFSAMGVAVPGLETMQKGYVSDIRIMGEPAPGKDVAILKIDRQNLPTVKIGDDTTARTGDRVYVLGYPGVATFNPLLASQSIVEPTLTSGLISAKKTMPGGWDILQIDAAITHGNSGGPVFNEKGEVIGIATFGSIDFQTGAEIQGMNFAVPVSIAKQFLKEKNIVPEEGRLSKLYRDGLDLFKKNKYKNALDKFKEINDLNPGYPYVQAYISEARAAIVDKRDQSGPEINFVIIGAAGASVVLVLIIILILVLRRPGTKGQKENACNSIPVSNAMNGVQTPKTEQQHSKNYQLDQQVLQQMEQEIRERLEQQIKQQIQEQMKNSGGESNSVSSNPGENIKG